MTPYFTALPCEIDDVASYSEWKHARWKAMISVLDNHYILMKYSVNDELKWGQKYFPLS